MWRARNFVMRRCIKLLKHDFAHWSLAGLGIYYQKKQLTYVASGTTTSTHALQINASGT